MKDLKKETMVIISLIVLAVASRLLPHPPNFAPITGIALFAAVKFQHKLIALLLPLSCLFITDLILGLGWINLFVYGAFGVISLLGFATKKVKIQTVLLSSILFFLVSNLGVWLLYYPLSLEGLTTCFTLAIPFFTNTLLGDLAYTAVLFYSFSTLKNTYLRPA
ncbi:hypothetical protein OAP99_02545 [Flavobacteriaceae bacterium]|nr:hypothetical protein [Flavobacteriaceae bacterium]MDC1061048.1 hypothetical protein [Flavobacteriaceae bacterium]